MIRSHQIITLVSALLILAPLSAAAAQERPFEIEFELGSAWQAKNDVQIPGNAGTRFSLYDVVGSGPWASGRVNFNWNVSGRHGVRLVAAPLGYDETGFLPYPVNFAGQSFSDQQQVEARYRFNSWRVRLVQQRHGQPAAELLARPENRGRQSLATGIRISFLRMNQGVNGAS